MADVENALPIAARRELRQSLAATNDPFIEKLPKVELHVHIEGCLTPALKWKFSQRNKAPLINPRTNTPFQSLEELQTSHDNMTDTTNEARMNNTQETLSFFEAYYSGFAALQTQQDFHDLAMSYYEKAASINIRYAEIFFDPQGHTQTGTAWETMMTGFRSARVQAQTTLNIQSNFIMCFLRDWSPESAMQHYVAAQPYLDMIVGIGLDSNETERPAILFAEIFARARNDGLKLTAHCDVGSAYPVSHIEQCLSPPLSLDRIDHGLNITSFPDLMARAKQNGVGFTSCPWSYIRHERFEEVWERLRRLFDSGVRVSFGSDDPAFMEDTWVREILMVLRRFCGFTDEELVRTVRDAVEMSWAGEGVKRGILEELEGVLKL